MSRVVSIHEGNLPLVYNYVISLCTSTRERLAGGNTGRRFLMFGGPVCADRISNCPLDRVLTYKNLIYLLNLQFTLLVIQLNWCVQRSFAVFPWENVIVFFLLNYYILLIY